MCCFFLSVLRSGIVQFGQVHATRLTLGFVSGANEEFELMLTVEDCVEGVTLMVVAAVEDVGFVSLLEELITTVRNIFFNHFQTFRIVHSPGAG